MLRRALLSTMPLLAVPSLAAPVRAATRQKVVATFSILGDLVREVGGEEVEVVTIVGPDTDSHAFQPTPAAARKLAGAQVLVSNGMGFEGWLDRLAEAAEFKGKRIVASQGCSIVGNDPHCWQDVANARRYAATIARGLGTSRERAALYDGRLAALDAWVRGQIATVPDGKRRIITNHDAFGYFARAYGVAVESALGATTEGEPSARDIANLVRQTRAQKIKALFVENFGNPALVAEIAHDSGAALGPPLYSDALSRPEGPAPTYEAMMRYNVAALVAGMLKN